MSLGSPSSKYSIELVDPSGNLLAELSGRAKNRTFTVTRNAADDIEWYLDIDEFERYCRAAKTDPRLVLISNNTEVRVKRRGSYLAGGQLNYKYGVLSENGDGNLIQIRAAGFLNLFTQRFTSDTQIYTGVDGSQIAWDLINQSQLGTNDPTGTVIPATGLITPGSATSGIPVGDWNFGITAGNLPAVGVHNRTYQNMAISDALADLTNSPNGSLDIQFTYNKIFNTFVQMGTQRPDIVLEYPGNITELDITEDGTQMANFITAQGSGNGTVSLEEASVPSLGSTATYKVRQNYLSPSSLDTTDDSLQDYATWNVAQTQSSLVLPSIIYDGDMSPFVTDYSVGDWIHIKITNHPLYQDINAMYRVEQIQVAVDDDDHELITVTTSMT